MTDLEQLLSKIDETIRRDVNHLITEANEGKLAGNSARDLVQYRKLISEALEGIEKAAKSLPSKTEEELKKMAKELLK